MLHLRPGRDGGPEVTRRIPVAQAAWPKVLSEIESLESYSKKEKEELVEHGLAEQSKLPGIPADVLEAFRPYID